MILSLSIPVKPIQYFVLRMNPLNASIRLETDTYSLPRRIAGYSSLFVLDTNRREFNVEMVRYE